VVDSNDWQDVYPLSRHHTATLIKVAVWFLFLSGFTDIH
jgi:hypothetical protein